MPTYDRPSDLGRIRVYDNGGHTVDRYLVLFEDEATVTRDGTHPLDKPEPYGYRFGFALSPNPGHPQGVSIADYFRPPETYGAGRTHRRIKWDDLPESVRQHVIGRMQAD